ncbi:MAG: hypothetical protein F6K17_06240 [Okeania sp. SIO3C4]|nr:hypothetical protein [Okeania sp. SIO3C4]
MRPDSFLRRALAQTKMISQIIAYIWLNADSDDLARQAREWFQNPTKNFDGIYENCNEWDRLPSIAKLMGASYEEETQYSELLCNVFPDVQGNDFYKFPIFNRYDIESGIVLFETDVNIFNGSILDPDINAPNLLRVVIAFPPCPKFDEATLTKRELRQWLKNRDPDQYMANNAYIPTCSC